MTAPRTLLAAWNLKPKKQLGQNFLTQPATAQMLVARGGIGPADVVLEIGAGLGALTIALARVAKAVVAVETDRRLVHLLQTEILSAGLHNVTVIHADALELDWNGLAGTVPLVVAGNLPYHIASPIVVRLIENRHRIGKAVVMVQKEMAQRLTARPGSRDYGRLSVMLQYVATVEKIADLGAGQFYPKPRVDSQVIRICFRPPADPVAHSQSVLTRVVQAAFGQRRKTLKNALAGSFLELDPSAAERLLTSVGVAARRRAETLTVAEFVALSNAYGRMAVAGGEWKNEANPIKNP